MNKLIAVCGLDCAQCEAYIATQNNDDMLREKVAKSWSELNKVEITKEMINCDGCRMDGRKTPFCDSLCPIRQCSIKTQVEHCGQCKALSTCQTIQMITGTNTDALNRLTNSSDCTEEPANHETNVSSISKSFTSIQPEIYIQYRDREALTDDIIDRVKAHYASRNHSEPIEKIQVYLNIVESTAYYVINDRVFDKINIFA